LSKKKGEANKPVPQWFLKNTDPKKQRERNRKVKITIIDCCKKRNNRSDTAKIVRTLQQS